MVIDRRSNRPRRIAERSRSGGAWRSDEPRGALARVAPCSRRFPVPPREEAVGCEGAQTCRTAERAKDGGKECRCEKDDRSEGSAGWDKACHPPFRQDRHPAQHGQTGRQIDHPAQAVSTVQISKP
ncbi:MAG: hypothetical protein JO228_04950 [Xanthobacteraceae bacterium]|nr:hypothetical protein [Xanthobacteraceae bacterium]